MLSTTDFQVTQDLTNVTNPTGAQLNQIAGTAIPFPDKGLIGWTTDIAGVPVVPNAATVGGIPKWQQYFWGRIQPVYNGSNNNTPIVTVYMWNPNIASAATFLQWQSLFSGGIAAGAISTFMIAAGAIVDNLVTSVSWTKLIATGATANQILVVNAGGTAFQLNTNIFAASAIAGAIGTANSVLAVNPAGTDLQYVPPGTANQVLCVNSAGNAVKFAGLTSIAPHGVLQIQVTPADNISTATNTVVNSNVLTGANGTLWGTFTFTPLSATSSLFVEFDSYPNSLVGTPSGINVGLCEGTTTNICTRWIALNGSSVYEPVSPVRLVASLTPGSTAQLTFNIYIAATSTGTVGMGYATYSGTFKVTEYY